MPLKKKKGHIDDYQAHEKMFNIANREKNANQNHRNHFTPQNGCHQKGHK